ncbi:septation protein SpoVG family protein [Rhodopirellula sp.]|nr:septation protein SpoVG family protein [Rhodopirellula sp.]MDB4679234.1 septation protein SpoVG family protein [Rhodopirellula sp.]
MEITEIRIKLMDETEDRLRAFCSLTINDAFVIRDLKIIDGSSGTFVAMPSRKLTHNCHRCRYKNQLRANYCNHCGTKQRPDGNSGQGAPKKLYADVAHPINSECRDKLQNAVLAEFESELQRCEEPDYRSRYDDDFTEIASTTKVDQPEHGPPKPHLPSEQQNTPQVDTAEPRQEDSTQPRQQASQEPTKSSPQKSEHKKLTEAKSSEADSEDPFGLGVF